MFFEDCVFYWGHRLLHTPFFYKLIHKFHHKSYNVITLSAVYVHPVEYVLGNALPSLIGLFIFKRRVHAVSFLNWINVRMLETHEGHSGIELPFSPFGVLPFSTGGEYHSFHHEKNSGNYGSMTSIWDDLFGTSKPFYDLVAAREKEKKANNTGVKNEKTSKPKSE